MPSDPTPDLVERLRYGHHSCDDSYYSCPQHESYFGVDDPTKCYCSHTVRHEAAAEIVELRAERDLWKNRFTILQSDIEDVWAKSPSRFAVDDEGGV